MVFLDVESRRMSKWPSLKQGNHLLEIIECMIYKVNQLKASSHSVILSRFVFVTDCFFDKVFMDIYGLINIYRVYRSISVTDKESLAPSATTIETQQCIFFITN